ncbi:MAG: hypothetical protein WCY09_07255 [Candidatus Omnitrophota bacterium]
MKNEQFESDIKIVPGSFNKLSLVETDSEQFLTGELDIVDNAGRLWDTYQVEIRGSESYPTAFPKLFEIGNAFPKIIDWHVYESYDKSCCVDIPPNERILCKDGLHVLKYIQQFAIPYLANQTFRRHEGYYLYGEYPHGIFGKIEYYQSKLKAKNPHELISMFDLIIKGYNPDRTSYCPFCNKVKFRNCHRDVFRELSAIKVVLYLDAVNQLIPFFKENPVFKLPVVK